MKNIYEVVVNCETWARGGKNGKAALLNDQCHLCCLGFECIQRGLKVKDIKNLGMPATAANNNLGFDIPGMTSNLRDTALIQECSRINDDPNINDTTRMSRLKETFRSRGLRIRFTNRPDGIIE